MSSLAVRVSGDTPLAGTYIQHVRPEGDVWNDFTGWRDRYLGVTQVGEVLTEFVSARERFWIGGVLVGYRVAFGECAREMLPASGAVLGWQALQTRYAEHLTDAKAYRSGVAYGYHLATAYRDDALECGECGRRILTDVDEHAFCDVFGPVCNEECHSLAGCRRSDCPAVN